LLNQGLTDKFGMYYQYFAKKNRASAAPISIKAEVFCNYFISNKDEKC
jgi:hypothetical protein